MVHRKIGVLAIIRRVTLVLILGASSASGQQASVGGRSEVFVGSELERYIRLLQLDGRAAPYPWSIRGFSPPEIDSLLSGDKPHPWDKRYDLASRHRSVRVRLEGIAPSITLRFNSSFPFGSNDGPVWAGRGLTTAVQAGFSARWGAFSASIAPLAFRAENRPFELMPNGESGSQRFGDRQYPFSVDRPQRFGARPYTLLDPGESSIRFDTHLLTLGVSTAAQGWGPGDTYPLILGNNAAGFPHAFVGTGSPFNLWLFHLHTRLVYGELAQSAYSNISSSDSVLARRFMSGMVLTAQPRGIPGLEIGLSRFFHNPWPQDKATWRQDLRIPFEAFYKVSSAGGVYADDKRNQLASFFGRWVLSHSGLEIYGEFGKEDHNADERDFVLEPNHGAFYMLGFRALLSSSADRLVSLRAETVDFRLNNLTTTREFGGYYVHGYLAQGHTERGQLLGADVSAGSGGATTVAVEGYHRRGRWFFTWTRTLIDLLPAYTWRSTTAPRVPEAQHALSADFLFFRGKVDGRFGVTAVYDLNRYFERDAFNLNAIVGARWSL